MAVKKKAENLTIEEKLAQALVSESEQPYKVPENWCWTTLDKVSNVVTGKTPSKNHQEFYGNEFPFFKPADLDAGRNVFVASEYLSEEGKNVSVIVPQNSTAVCCIGSIGKSGFLNRDGTTNQQINSAIPFINPLYLYYFIKTDFFVNQLWEKASATTIAIVNKSKMEQCHFALAPLSEQQRIVERIESLFAKLDEAKEKLQEVLDGFETRRAAILHKAFSGELTAKWREEHGVSLDGWEKKSLDSVCYSIFDGDHMPPPKSETGVPFLVISNVNKGHLSFDNTRYVPEEYYNNLSETRKPRLGDVLCTIVGTFGIPVIVDSDRKFCFQRHMALLKPRDINTKFLWYLLQWKNMYNKLAEIATGTAQLTVPIKGLRTVNFLMPTIQEQIEIVKVIESILNESDRSKCIIESCLKDVNAIKKSILARAFRGELGTNDENDEWAVELLKRVL